MTDEWGEMFSVKESRGCQLEQNEDGGTPNGTQSVPADAAFEGLHPLLIDHIMKQVFEMLLRPCESSLYDKITKDVAAQMQTIRLVCKSWHDVATRLYRSHRGSLDFGRGGKQDVKESAEDDSSDDKEFNGNHDDDYVTSSPEGRMARFLKTMRNSSLIPVESYEIPSEVFCRRKSHNVRKNERLLLDFFRVSGSSLVDLRITLDDPCSVNLAGFDFAGIQLPSMKYLWIHLRYVVLPSKQSKHEQLITVLLKATLNLRNFGINTFTTDYFEDLNSYRETESLLRTVFTNLPVSTTMLDLDGILLDQESSKLFSILTEDKFLKLADLCILWQGSASSELMFKFLEAQKTTLKCLTFGGPSAVGSLRVPNLPLLEELTLESEEVQLLSPVATGFPCLRKLNAEDWDKGADEAFPVIFMKNGSKPQLPPPLCEIRLPRHVTAEPVKGIGLSFPFLTKIQYAPPEGADYASFVPVAKAIFQYCVYVEELDIKYPPSTWEDDGEENNFRNMDSLLSGIPKEECAGLREQRSEWDTIDISNFSCGPSILNLAKLRRLRMLKMYRTSRYYALTRFSIQLIFLRMETLQELRVSAFDFHPKLSARVKELFDAKFNTATANNKYDDDLNWF